MRVTRAAERPVPRESGPSLVAPELACRTVHGVLERLPRHSSSGEARVADGLYFFYEDGESSTHGQRGRVVRVGTHQAEGGLRRRLSQHYSGRKNGSAFRKSLGGALLRRSDPQNPCLGPTPGGGHWERQGEDACGLCAPTETEVSRLVSERFGFRVVAVVDPEQREQFERRLIATLAACSICGPSAAWLGSFAYADAMRRCGLWNTKDVNGPTLTAAQLRHFEGLVAETAQQDDPPRGPVASARIPKAMGAASAPYDASATLVVIPCSWGKRRGSDERDLGPGVVDHLPEDLRTRLSEARVRVAPVARVDQTRMAAWRRYGPGLLYREAGDSLARGVEHWPHVLILSGAYGVVMAREPIGHYERQLDLGDWPRGLLQEVLASYAARHRIGRVVGLAARSGDYRVTLAETRWPACVRSEAVYMPARVPDVKPQESTPSMMGRALAALLDGCADLASWRDPVYGSRLE